MAEAPDDCQHRSIRFEVQLFAQQRLVDLGVPESSACISRRGERRNQPRRRTRAARIERGQPPPPFDGAAGLVTFRGGDRETLERLSDQPSEPRALRLDPALELWRSVRVVQVNAVEEQVVGAELATEGGQGLCERVPRVLRVAVGPEEGQQSIAADPALSSRRKHSEQGQLAALRGRPGDQTALAGEREPAERAEPQGHSSADFYLTSGCSWRLTYGPSGRPQGQRSAACHAL